MKERCLIVSSLMAEHKTNYVYNMLALIKKFHANGDELVFMFPKAKTNAEWVDEIRQEGCKVYFLDYNPYSLNNVKFIKKIIKDENINIVQSDYTGWDITVKLAKPFIPTIWYERMRVNDKDTVKKLENLIKYKIVGAFNTFSVGISDDVYHSLCNLSKESRCEKIYNAFDPSRFSLSYPKADNDIKTYLMFSYSPKVKGTDIVCDAFEEFNRDSVKAKLIIVSHGINDDYLNGRYKQTPEWLTVEKPRSDVEYYYSRADSFISASRSEGFSYALLEAVYMGIRCIASDIPGTAWSERFKGVRYFKSGDSASLLEALENDIDSNINKEDAEFNRQKILTDFSFENWVEQVYALHKKVLNR